MNYLKSFIDIVRVWKKEHWSERKPETFQLTIKTDFLIGKCCVETFQLKVKTYKGHNDKGYSPKLDFNFSLFLQ